MRAFLYTVLLSAILVASVVYLRSIQRQTQVPGSVEVEEQRPMVVHSEPPPISNLKAGELERVNQEALYETGLELMNLWHLPESIDVFETLIEKDPTHVDAHLRLVECYADPIVGSEKRARERWQDAWSLVVETGQDTLWASAFRNLFVEVLPSTGIGKLNAIVEGDAENLDARLLLAKALLMDGKPEESSEHLRRLLHGDQSLGRARELLIQCEILKENYVEAENLARELTAVFPDEPFPHVLLSRALLVAGKVDEAVQACDNALIRDKRYIPAIVTRAYLYLAKGEREAAKVSFEKLMMFDDPMLASLGSEGQAYADFLYGQFDEATEAMDEAIRLSMSADSPRRAMLYALRLVDYLCELGRVDAAAAVLDRWVSRYAKAPGELGEIRIRISQGRLDAARRLIDGLPRDEQLQAWMRSLGLGYVDLEALTFLKEKNFAQALAVLNASDDNGNATRRAYLTGYALFQNGDAESAVDFFDKTRYRLYRAVFPYHDDPIVAVQSVFFLAEAALARGEGEKAKRFYRDFLEFWGSANWDLQAVERARRTLETLSMKSTGE